MPFQQQLPENTTLQELIDDLVGIQQLLPEDSLPAETQTEPDITAPEVMLSQIEENIV